MQFQIHSDGKIALKLKTILLIWIALMVVSCAANDRPGFTKMSREELAAYNATVAQVDQVGCVELRVRGTQQITRTVCGTERQLARRIGGPSSFPGDEPYRPRTSSLGNRGQRPKIYFSPPPPGYDQPIIHIRDPRL